MNTPNKLSVARIVMSVLIVLILLIPLESMGISVHKIFVNELLVIDVRYLVAGGLFIVASFTDFLDGFIARKYNMVTDTGKLLDAIADKVLVNSALIILAADGFIHPIIPVVIISRDSIVNSIRMIAGSKGKVVAAGNLGKIKTIFMMTGISLTFFYNLPFELWNIQISNALLLVATLLSVISAYQYYSANKKLIMSKE